MSRKRHEALRKALFLREKRYRYYIILDRIMSRNFTLYKKAHLERKRRARIKQVKKKTGYKEEVFLSYRCVSCNCLTMHFHIFWKNVLCTLCYHNPYVIRGILSSMQRKVIAEDPVCAEELHFREMEFLEMQRRRHEEQPLYQEVLAEKKEIKDILVKYAQNCPDFFHEFIPRSTTTTYIPEPHTN